MLLFVSVESFSTLLLGTFKWVALLGILAFTSFIRILFTQTLGFLQGLQRIREMGAINLIYTVAEKVLAIYLLYAGWELFGVICGWLMGLIPSSLIGLILTARFLGILGKPHHAKPLINFSYPLYISGILAFAVNWVDQLFILPYMGVVYLGVYYIAIKAALVPGLISSSIFTALFPKLSELYTRGGADSLREAFHVATRYVVMAGFPVIVGLAVLAHPAMVLFAGVEYAETALPLTILCIAQLPVTLGVAIRPTLMTLEHAKTRLMLNVAYMLFETFMCYTALAHLNLGMPGAAWARAFTGLAGFGLAVYALRRVLKITIDKEAFWKASAASIIMAAVIALLEISIFYLYLLPLHLMLPLLIIIGSVTYFLSLVALRTIKKRDVELLHDYLPKRLKHVAFWLSRAAFIG
jgi:O-antigen/teichoic acid export membrane protein